MIYLVLAGHPQGSVSILEIHGRPWLTVNAHVAGWEVWPQVPPSSGKNLGGPKLDLPLRAPGMNKKASVNQGSPPLEDELIQPKAVFYL